MFHLRKAGAVPAPKSEWLSGKHLSWEKWSVQLKNYLLLPLDLCPMQSQRGGGVMGRKSCLLGWPYFRQSELAGSDNSGKARSGDE